jgi:hypothetical protein
VAACFAPTPWSTDGSVILPLLPGAFAGLIDNDLAHVLQHDDQQQTFPVVTISVPVFITKTILQHVQYILDTGMTFAEDNEKEWFGFGIVRTQWFVHAVVVGPIVVFHGGVRKIPRRGDKVIVVH